MIKRGLKKFSGRNALGTMNVGKKRSFIAHGYSFFILISLLLWAATFAQARDFAEVPEEFVESLTVHTDDGVALRRFRLINANQPRILLMPGFFAKGVSLSLLAEAFYGADFEPVVANWRGSEFICTEDRCESTPLAPDSNDLEDLVRYDFMAHWRSVVKDASPDQIRDGIAYLGHSMGGMLMAAALSEPDLAAEIRPHLKGLILFQSPHHLRDVPRSIKIAARMGMPLLQFLKRAGIKEINLPSKVLGWDKAIKSKGGFQGRFLVPAAEAAVMALIKYFMNPAHTGREDFRRTVFRKGADSVPLDLIISMAKAINEPGGVIRKRNGDRLIKPELLTGIPILVARAQHDSLASWREQQEYYDALGTTDKQLINIRHLNHVTTLMVRNEAFNYFDLIRQFAQDPQAAIRTGKQRESASLCANWLSHIGVAYQNLLPYPFGLKR